MAIGREARRRERQDRVSEVFGDRRRYAALDLLELLEFTWHRPWINDPVIQSA